MKPFKLIFLYARDYIASLTITAWSMLALVGAVTDPNPATNTMQLVNRQTIIDRAILQFLCSYNMDHVAGCSMVADKRRYIYEQVQQLCMAFDGGKHLAQLEPAILSNIN